MKKKVMVPILIIVATFFICVGIWWFTPKFFLHNVNLEKIASIEVFNGNDGNRFMITKQDDIAFIVENINAIPMKKESIAVGMGTSYNLRFLNESGNETDKFIIMNPKTIRKGIVFYECNGELKQIEDYLINLEKIQFPDTDWIIGQS